MANKKENAKNRLEKAEQENRALALKYLNLKYYVASQDYKRGFREGIKFLIEFPNAGQEMVKYLEKTEPDR